MATCPTCRNRFDAATFCPRDGTRLVGDVAPDALLGGRYRLIRKVGAGGMGEVYEAEHALIHRRVAVKILQRSLASDPEAIERLQREAQSTSGIGHPNIVDTLDFGWSDDGEVFLVMEWLEGENLDQRLQRGPIEIPTGLEIAAQAAAGLAEAHDRGVIHRDLKPANLFLIRDRRGALVVKVLDFGIAKLAAHHTKLTGTGVLVGTPNYMAPEQAFGEEVDARADIYALGVILYELVTGQVPFHADSPLAVLHQHTSRMPAPPSTIAPDRGITRDVEALVMRCLAKKPGDRFASMHELAQAIEAVRHGRTAPAPAPPPTPAPERTDDDDDELLRAAGVRDGRRVLIAIVLMLALGGAAVAAFLLLRDGGTARAPAATSPDAAAAIARTPDAAVTTPPPIDAASAPPPDAAPVREPAWTHRGKGKLSTFRAEIASAPRVGEAFDLRVTLADLRSAAHEAEHDGTLVAELSIAYFKDHSVVHGSTHSLDAGLSFVAPITLARPGKHHVTITLRAGGRQVDRLRFDVYVGE